MIYFCVLRVTLCDPLWFILLSFNTKDTKDVTKDVTKYLLNRLYGGI